MQLEFPHDRTGAVSAGIEFWSQLGSTLDPERARWIGEKIADPSWENAGDDFAEGPRNTRRDLGLPLSGALPQGASMTLGPVGWQVREESGDEVTVLVLAYVTTSTSQAGVQQRLGVYPAKLHWSGGDWRMRDGGNGDYTSLAVAPGTPQAAAAGWQDFVV
ncbi:hypothetical protein [Pilimelia anulata]|nr:hypothetical protein [Pilimelia anulata]